MRRVAGPLLLPLIALAGTACDSDDPLEFEKRNVALSFTAPGGSAGEFLVYELFEDSEDIDGNGVPEGDGLPDGPVTLYCERLLETGGAAAFGSPVSMPWAYSIQVNVLRQGSNAPETLVNSVATPPPYGDPTQTNLAAFDTRDELAGAPALDEITLARRVGVCLRDESVGCDPDGSTDTCGTEGPCVIVGSCDADPSQSCYVTPPNGTGCLNTRGAPCDCTVLPTTGTSNGVCCTAALHGVGQCTAATEGSCTETIEWGCRPGCSELGAGSTCNPETRLRLLKFGAPRRLTAANREVLEAGQNLISIIDPSLAPTSDPVGGICPGFDLGPGGIQGQGEPFMLSLKKGDTLIVKARRFDEGPAGVPVETKPNINATIVVDGQTVAPDGSVTTAGGGGIDYTFTAR